MMKTGFLMSKSMFEQRPLLKMEVSSKLLSHLPSNDVIAPDKAAYCVFTQFHGPENAIKFIFLCVQKRNKNP